MHSYPHYVNLSRGDDHLAFASAMSQPLHQHHDQTWQAVEPFLYNSQLEQRQKLLNPENSFYQSANGYIVPQPYTCENINHSISMPAWNVSSDSYGDLRYTSPNGQFGGTLSESSSDYAVSPEVTRQQMACNTTEYLSPPSDAQFIPQTWSEAASFMLTPTSTCASMQTPLIAMKELEFPVNPEFQLELQEDDLRAQQPINIPEELEISDGVTALNAIQATNTLAISPCGTGSSASSPAQDHDSDSDFDPKSKPSKSGVGSKQLASRTIRRASSSSLYPTLDASNRIHKAANQRSNQSKEKSKSRHPSQPSSVRTMSKSFPCAFHAFGCSITFANKNEWKRHVTTQHLQLGFYRCDLGTCNPDNVVSPSRASQSVSRGRGHNKRRSISHSYLHILESDEEVKTYNDFNRKDLFTQHCRRMHGPLRHLVDETTQTNQAINARLHALGRKQNPSGKPMSTKDDEAAFEEELEIIRTRCWTQQRHAPTRSTCGFCSKVFEPNLDSSDDGKAEERAWEERMEHIGRHYERDGACVEKELLDHSLMNWGLDQGVLQKIDGVGCGVWLAGYELPSDNSAQSETRETSRRRGPRRRVSIPVTSSATPSPRSNGRTHLTIDESDEDAMVEDE